MVCGVAFFFFFPCQGFSLGVYRGVFWPPGVVLVVGVFFFFFFFLVKTGDIPSGTLRIFNYVKY